MKSPEGMKLANAAVTIIESINSTAQKHTMADAREAEVDLLLHHIKSGKMSDEEIARAQDTISMINTGRRSFGGVE